MPNKLENKLEKALRRQDRNTQKKQTELSGTMGVVLNGIQTVEVPGRSGFVYVLLNTKEQELIQAFNDKVSGVYGLAVIVVWKVNRYEVLRKDDIRYGTWNSSYLPKHGNQHSFNPDGGGGGDVSFIYGKQFVPLSLTPSGQFGAPVAIVAGYAQQDSGWHYIPDTPTPNITNHKPTTGVARMVLVALDWQTRAVQLIIGTGSFSASLTGTSDVIPYLPSTTGVYQVPIAGVRLVSGTTAITWQHIYDVRQYFHPIFTGTSAGGGGGGSSIDTIGIAGLDEGIPLGTGTAINFVGAGVTATRSGTMFNVNIPGGSSASDATYLRLDTANDPLTNTLDVVTPDNTPGERIYTPNEVGLTINNIADNFGSQNYQALWIDRYYTGTPAGEFYSPAIEVRDNLTRDGVGLAKFFAGTLKHIYYSGTTPSYRPIPITEIDPYANPTTGSVFLLNAQTPISPTHHYMLLKVQNQEIFRINGSGTALSNGTPLIKEAPINGLPYVRRNAGWELASTGSAGGGGSGLGVYVQDEGVGLGTGTTLNFVGAGVSASIAGETVTVTIPGGGGGGGNSFVGWNEGVSLGTGTILNVVSPSMALSVSGTVFNLSETFRGVRAYHTGTDQTAVTAASGTSLLFNAENFDTDGFHSTTVATDKFTVPVGLAGKYHIGCGFYGNTNVDLRIRINGTKIVALGRQGAGASTIAAYIADTVYNLNEGDYVELVAIGQGGARTITTDPEISPYFWMYFLGR